ncbi:hypothetical protein EVAR_78445_1 [Eumeta japonica]|uniref:Uncharacterized protein n=1 Tax=Eumeta variegata TaxID=151549 RepID=A0A4C1TY84_EUMVA|nr:hypothetical protein EVAR_78445_1 [Eumeta japonica]
MLFKARNSLVDSLVVRIEPNAFRLEGNAFDHLATASARRCNRCLLIELAFILGDNRARILQTGYESRELSRNSPLRVRGRRAPAAMARAFSEARAIDLYEL